VSEHASSAPPSRFWWWPLLASHRPTLIKGLGATLLCSLAAAFVPAWAGRAVHALELGRFAESRTLLLWMLAFTAAAGIGRYGMRNILIGLSREIEREQREQLFAHYLAQPFAFFERHRIGDLMARIGDDVGTVRMATGPGLMSFLQTASILPVTLSLMLHISVPLTLAVMAPFALLAAGFYLVGRWSHKVQQKIQLVTSALTTFSHETIQGEKVVQAFGLEGLRVGRFEELSRQQASLSIRQTALFSAYAPLAILMGGASALILVAFGGRMVTLKQLSLGDLTAFTGFLSALAWPVMSLGWAVNLFQRARAGQDRITQILQDADPPLPAPPPAGPVAPVALALTDVAYRFETGRGLGPVSFAVPAGGSLAILGGIGSGKTLLLQILAGLKARQSGELAVDGVPLELGSLRAHWNRLGWVPQEAFLFSTTLRENLAMGRPEASEAELLEAARAVTLDGLLGRLPEGLDTVVGERGVILSGGERQRAALGRALLRRPGLLLMDDALSAVDAETESRILENLRAYLGTTTLVMATHRVFVAELCERIIVLEEGRLVQSGTPQELAEQPGTYARLKRLQSLERELMVDAGASGD
jgi:ATP-binding cassette subfamily B protein